MVRLTGERPAILSQDTSGVPIARGAVWTLAVVLAPSDPAGLAAYEEAVNDPANPSYQQYLTADEWTARFGPSPADETAVAAYLKRGGLTVMDEASNLQVIRVLGTVAQIDQLLDPDFQRLFKIKAQFGPSMDRSPETMLAYAAFVSGQVNAHGLLPFGSDAVARVIEHGARLAENQGRLTTSFEAIDDLLVESDHVARGAGAGLVEARRVDAALAARDIV